MEHDPRTASLGRTNDYGRASWSAQAPAKGTGKGGAAWKRSATAQPSARWASDSTAWKHSARPYSNPPPSSNNANGPKPSVALAPTPKAVAVELTDFFVPDCEMTSPVSTQCDRLRREFARNRIAKKAIAAAVHYRCYEERRSPWSLLDRELAGEEPPSE